MRHLPRMLAYTQHDDDDDDDGGTSTTRESKSRSTWKQFPSRTRNLLSTEHFACGGRFPLKTARAFVSVWNGFDDAGDMRRVGIGWSGAPGLDQS